MFSLLGLVALLVAHYTKVHEIWTFLWKVPVIHILYVGSAIGMALDIRLRIARLEACPQVRMVLPLWLWTVLTGLLNGSEPGLEVSSTLVYMLLFMLIAHGAQSLRALRLVTMSMLVISMFLGVVAFAQRQAPFQCIGVTAAGPDQASGKPDGRFCDQPSDCREGADYGEDFVCERPGPFSTMSVAHGRVRYRGFLEDPNELALILVMSLPFALNALVQRPGLPTLLLVLAVFVITLPVVIWTASRTGQYAFLVVISVYLVRKIGLKGILAAAILAIPALALGGRSGGEAEESSLGRLEAWDAGLDMLRSSPIWGIGRAQFTNHHYLTAHNSFVLEAAELGLVGMILWLGVLYTGFKIVLSAMRKYRTAPDGAEAYSWALALFAALSGMIVGMSFLSLAYHTIIWAYLALPGAYYLAVRRHDPGFRVTFGLKDLAAVAGFAVLYLIGVAGYLMVRSH